MTNMVSNPKVIYADEIDKLYKKKDTDINILEEFYSNIIFTFKEKITKGDYKYIIKHLEILKKRIDSFIENIENEEDVNIFNTFVSYIKGQLLAIQDSSKKKKYKNTISYKNEAYIILETGDKITDNLNHIDVTLYLVYKENILYILKNTKYTNKYFKNDQDIHELKYEIYRSDNKVRTLVDVFHKKIMEISTTTVSSTLGGMKKVSYKLNSDNVKKLLHNNKKHKKY